MRCLPDDDVVVVCENGASVLGYLDMVGIRVFHLTILANMDATTQVRGGGAQRNGGRLKLPGMKDSERPHCRM